MALSDNVKLALKRAMALDAISDEFINQVDDLMTQVDAIDVEVTPQTAPAAEAAYTAGTNLSLASPAASALNAVFDDTEVEAALDTKADQTAVNTLMGDIETRLDAVDAKLALLVTKINEFRTALIASGVLE